MLVIYEKELLVVIHALQSRKHYLLGNLLVLQMDHQSLRYFMMQAKLSENKMSCANYMLQFYFYLAHVLEKLSPLAHDFSKRP